MNITYISKDKRGEHFQRIPLEQFVEEVRSQKYLSAIEVVNLYYPGANDSRNARGDIDLLTGRLPQVCFAAEWENRRGERIAKNINRLVLLEINHLRDQLLATEVRRYWFNDEENARIQQQNARYQRVADFETMIRQTFLPPQRIAASPQSPMMPLADIIDLLERHYPTFRRTRGINERLGRVLTQMGYEVTHRKHGNSYYISLIE